MAPGIERMLDKPEVDLAFCIDLDPNTLRGDPHQAWSLVTAETAEDLWTDLLRQWLDQLKPDLPPRLLSSSYGLSLSLIDDDSMAELNNQWRQIHRTTDVLAFAAQESAPPLPSSKEAGSMNMPLELGDIMISLPTAARQAQEAGHPLEQELLFLASHGLLHLLGWDHPDEASLAAMLNQQNELMANTPPPSLTGTSLNEDTFAFLHTAGESGAGQGISQRAGDGTRLMW